MSFDNHYPNRKDKRRAYYGAKSHSRGCRNHGRCPYCASGRAYKNKRGARAGSLHDEI